jgi:hypothetical protein
VAALDSCVGARGHHETGIGGLAPTVSSIAARPMFECRRPLARVLDFDHKANSIRRTARRVLLRDPVHDCVIGIVAHRAIKQAPHRG